MRHRPLFLHALLTVVAITTVTGCAGSNRLKHYDFDGREAAVVAAIPPRPLVFTDDLFSARVDPRDPVGSVLRVGTAVAREAEAHRAQARMDSALAHVDVAERIARQTLVQGATYLGYRPANDPRSADYLLDIRVADYGLVADSWDASVYFDIDAEVLLVDNRTKRVIWKERLREAEPVSDAFGGLGATFGNVYTARALSQLSTEDMIVALERLADYTAGRLTAELRDDFYKSRR